MKISEAIMLARKRAGLTQKQLAQKSGVTASTLSNWELGLRAPMLPPLIAVADALGISLDKLVGREP